MQAFSIFAQMQFSYVVSFIMVIQHYDLIVKKPNPSIITRNLVRIFYRCLGPRVRRTSVILTIERSFYTLNPTPLTLCIYIFIVYISIHFYFSGSGVPSFCRDCISLVVIYRVEKASTN